MSIMATRVESLPKHECQLLVRYAPGTPYGRGCGPTCTTDCGYCKGASAFLHGLVQAMLAASEDHLDRLETAYPDLVHAVRVWRFFAGGRERVTAIATSRLRHQCGECGWPMDTGHRPVPGEDDVEGWNYCTNPTCNNKD